MALIEIDGLPFLKMVDLSMAMLNNQRVYLYIYIYMYHYTHIHVCGISIMIICDILYIIYCPLSIIYHILLYVNICIF